MFTRINIIEYFRTELVLFYQIVISKHLNVVQFEKRFLRLFKINLLNSIIINRTTKANVII